MMYPEVQTEVDLSATNTLKLHSVAERALRLVGTVQAAMHTLEALEECPAQILGQASNVVLHQSLPGLTLLVATQGIDVVSTSRTEVLVNVAAGLDWHGWVMHCMRCGWWGLENLALIPGTVGAAPIQNIGAYGAEVGERIEAVQVWDFVSRRSFWLAAADCLFTYRDSVFKRQPHWLVLQVRFRLSCSDAYTVNTGYADLARQAAHRALSPADVAHAVIELRTRKLPDPAVEPNVGSFFKNPTLSTREHLELEQRCAAAQRPMPATWPVDKTGTQSKVSAAALIEACGWKGRVKNGAAVSARHALVLINSGCNSATEVLALAADIAASVQARFGVQLDMEPSIFGVPDA